MKNMLNKIIKNKSTMLVIGGTAISAYGLILLGKASMKCETIIAQRKNNEEIINGCAIVDGEYSEEDQVNDLKINKIQTNVKLVFNYGIPMAMIVAGGVMYINGQNEKVKAAIQDIEMRKYMNASL